MASWFVKPESQRIDLSDGQWIEVKKFLTAGEELSITQAFTAMRQGREGEQPTVEIDMKRWRIQRCSIYLLKWSLVDWEGKPVAVSEGALEALSGERLREIEAAIEAHTKRMEEEKNVPGIGGGGAVN